MITNGKIIVNEFGNGFLNITDMNDNQKSINIYIKKQNLNKAFHNEIVDVEYYMDENDSKYYGTVINYSLNNRTFIGNVHHIYKNEIFIYVSELTKSNLIIIKANVFVPKNSWVNVKIIENMNDDNKLYGEIIEILPANVDLLIEKKFNMDNIELENEIDKIILENNNNSNKHSDQKKLDTFTIDPASSQDCDDAFSIEEIKTDLYNIYVHISDVANYINPNLGESFDMIIKRGNTYYGKKTNWTMIPRKYADNYCSILPNKETKVVTSHFVYNKKENKINYVNWFYSIIISKNKYCYEKADSFLEKDDDNNDNNNTESLKFKLIYETSLLLKNEMNDFIISKETKSHQMIRYWMIKTNQLMCQEIKRIYRSNPDPSENKLYLLNEYIKFKTQNQNQTLDRQSIITFFENNNNNNNHNQLLSFLIKNILPKAYYTEENEFHYGLGINDYTHWTSPIRRGADLLNHCILKGFKIDIGQYLEYINECEIKQDMIERFIQEFNNTQTINIGDTFNAVIIGLSQFGIIVYINNLDSKYSIHISNLSSNKLIYDKIKNTLNNENNNSIQFRLFDEITVKVNKISVDNIHFYAF
jgi:ribonuclease R